jgi:3-methyladenine DNA glycosylase AlkC
MAKSKRTAIAENENALKHLFGEPLLKRMANSISSSISNADREVRQSFDKKRFLKVATRLQDLEMKPRVREIREQLKAQLPEDYPTALKILLNSATSSGLKSFDLWPYSDFIQTYGLEHPKVSLDALKVLTTLFTSEWAVRPFLAEDSKATLAYLEAAAQDSDVNVRRWASEGSRPRLPWGERLREFIQDPSRTAKILELLKYDEELFVRKSVANHLNDIAKDHPDYVVAVLKRWRDSAPSEHQAKVKWIISRSLRTLIKAGHPKALELIGVSTKLKAEIETVKIETPIVHFGKNLVFGFKLNSRSSRSENAVVDYVIHFVKANGKTAPKVFKLKTFVLGPRESVTVRKSHPVRKITTRKYFPGKHLLEIQVNGKILARKTWHLKI